MAHWEHRKEAKWKDFEFKQPYAKGLARLKEEVLAKTDFDPATLWQWGTMQAMALIGQASFHILWCPHQDHYEAFDCRVQRYFVQGMIDAAQDHAKRFGFQVRFDYTIPAGAETCHFTMWQASDEEREQWALLTEKLERKALRVVREE